MRWPLLLAGLALLAGIPGGALAQVPSTGPSGLHLSYADNPPTSTWVTFTGPPAAEAYVSFGPVGESRAEVEAHGSPNPGSERLVYTALMRDMRPGTRYEYQAVLGEQASETRTFTTAPDPGNHEPLTITMYADHGTPLPFRDDRADGQAPVEVMELARQLDPNVHLLAGDIAYVEGDARGWDRHFDLVAPLQSRVPTMAVPGNHERERNTGFLNYDNHLTMPNASDGRWWTAQVGSVLFVGTNTETACAESPRPSTRPGNGSNCEYTESNEPEPTQLAFLEEALARAANDTSVRWTVVLGHNAVYSSGSHGSTQGLVEHWAPVFERYGVDLVLQGHDHVYERTEPIRAGEPSPNGTVYITNGAAGSGTYSWQDEQPPDWSAARDNDHYGVLALDFTTDGIGGRYVTLEDGVIDRFSLNDTPDGVTYHEQTDRPAGNDTGTPESTPSAGPLALLATATLAAWLLGRSRREP